MTCHLTSVAIRERSHSVDYLRLCAYNLFSGSGRIEDLKYGESDAGGNIFLVVFRSY